MNARLTLNEWLAARSYEAIRCLETPQSALLPNGRRLRGVALTTNIVLARDRQLYLIEQDGTATSAPDDIVLRRASLIELQAGYWSAVTAYRERTLREVRQGVPITF
jgi:hypothetical protein